MTFEVKWNNQQYFGEEVRIETVRAALIKYNK